MRDVVDELDIPPQTQTIINVEFSEVERYFYAKLHSDSMEAIRNLIASVSQDYTGKDIADIRLSNATATRFLTSLLQLRQVCTVVNYTKHQILKFYIDITTL